MVSNSFATIVCNRHCLYLHNRSDLLHKHNLKIVNVFGNIGGGVRVLDQQKKILLHFLYLELYGN